MSLDFSQEYEAPIVTTSLTPQDDGEVSLRPRTLADYTGQEKAKGNLSVYIEAARRRKLIYINGKPLKEPMYGNPSAVPLIPLATTMHKPICAMDWMCTRCHACWVTRTST